jgi:hypothetical protein
MSDFMRIKLDLTDAEWEMLILNIQEYESERLFKTTLIDILFDQIVHKDYTNVNEGISWLQCITDEIKFSTTAFYMFEKIKNNRGYDFIELVGDEEWIFELFYNTQMNKYSEELVSFQNDRQRISENMNTFHRIFSCKIKFLDE